MRILDYSYKQMPGLSYLWHYSCVFSGEFCQCSYKTLSSDSVGLEPLYPQACQKQEIYVPANPGKASPVEVSMLLTSLPCSLALKRSDPISFYHLIAHSRHYMNNCIRNSVQFWLCCQVSITLLGLTSLLMLIPPIFTIADTMWLSIVVVPVLSLTLSFATMDTVSWT